jgi:cation diffusion facilitator CzcD-associated flavoprotein CzcO
VLDVAIVGAGQGGLGTAFGLLRERISNIQVFDRNHQGLEGPWVTFARMITLRTPKHITGPDYGVASLTPRAWYEAKYGVAAWAGWTRSPARIGRPICVGSAGSPTFRCKTTPMSPRSGRRVPRFA